MLKKYIYKNIYCRIKGFPDGSAVENLPAMQETQVRTLGQEDSPGEMNGYLLQCACLENPMDRGARWAAAHGVAKRHR